MGSVIVHRSNSRDVRDPNLVRLRCRVTGRYLHLSGQGSVSGKDWAWLGYRHQAARLATRAAIRGEDWPYVAVFRNEDREEQ